MRMLYYILVFRTDSIHHQIEYFVFSLYVYLQYQSNV